MVVSGCLTPLTISEKARARDLIFPFAVLRTVAAELSVQRLSTAEPITLLPALSSVPDPRKARGRRHSLPSILLLAVGAVLAGARSYAAIADWAAHAEHAVTVCGPRPHATTFARVLGALDAGAAGVRAHPVGASPPEPADGPTGRFGAGAGARRRRPPGASRGRQDPARRPERDRAAGQAGGRL